MSLCTRTWALRAGLAALIGLAQLIVGGAHAQYVQYLHTDALGSPVTVTDQSRGIVERNEYEPYGKVLGAPVQDGPGYTGHVSDAATGLSYMQQRYYDPAIGRFLSVDPVTTNTVTSWNFNRYNYAANNPYKFTDPDGRIIFLAAIPVAIEACAASVVCGTAVLGTAVYGLQHAINRAFGQKNEGTPPDAGDSPEPGTAGSDEGCIYCIPGEHTESGKDYVGSADDLEKRTKTARDGRDRSKAEKVDRYPKGDRKTRQEKEQQAMNDRGGKDELDNKRDEIRLDKWKERSVRPPRGKE